MKNRSKLNSIIFALVVVIVAAFSLVACGGSGDNSPLTEADYTVQSDAAIEAGEKFTPSIVAKNGAKIRRVELTNREGKVVALDDDMSFTATMLGVYTYKVTFEKGGVTKTVSFTVTARDSVAPVVTKKASDKTDVEIGYYDGFAAAASEIEVSDNSDDASHLTVAVKKITFGDSVFTSVGDKFFFENIGEYVVTLEITDRSGNAVETDYKIITTDTTAPVIKSKKPSFAWMNDMVKIEMPEVYEIGDYSLTATVRKGGLDFEVTDFTFAPDETGEYIVTYVATDASGNVSKPLETIVNVIASGTVADFGSDAEEGFWMLTDSEKIVGDGEMIVYGTDGGSIKRESISEDWSEFKTLNIVIANYKASTPVIRLGIGQNGKFVDICDFGIAPASSTGLTSATAVTSLLSVDLTKYGLNLAAVDAIRLTAVTKGAYKFGLKNISLSSELPSQSDKPTVDYVSVIDFESNISKTATYGGGSKANTNKDFVLKGNKSARYDIKAKGYVGEAFGEIKAKGTANTLVAYAYSESYSAIRLGGVFGGTSFTSGVYSLVPGWNRLEWYVGIDNDFSFADAGLGELTVKLEENYAATIYLDEIGFINKTAFADSELFIDKVTFGVSYGDAFVMSDVLKNNGKLASSVTAAVIDGDKTIEEIRALSNYGITADNKLAIGASKNLASGKYTLVFVATDILGGEHVAVYPLNAEQNVLSFSANIPTLHSGDDYMLTDVSVTSDVYTKEQLADATLKTYYKKDGYVHWTELDGTAFTTEESGFYRFKYVLSYDGVSVENIYRQFVHGSGVVADFEQSVAGDHFGFYADYMREYNRYYDPDYTDDMEIPLETSISSEWSYDGDYSLKYEPTHIGWGGWWFKGDYYQPEKSIPVEEGVNGFRIVINGSQPTRGVKFCVMTDKGWLYSDEVDIEAGVKEYYVKVAYANETRTANEEEITFNSVRGLIFCFANDPTKTYYMDSLAFVHVDENKIVEL